MSHVDAAPHFEASMPVYDEGDRCAWVSVRRVPGGTWDVKCAKCGRIGADGMTNAITHIDIAMLPQDTCAGAPS